MDMAGEDNRIGFEPQPESHETTVNYHSSNVLLNWGAVNQNPSNSFVEMVSSASTTIDSFGPSVWDHHFHNVGYSDVNFQSEAGTSSSSRSLRPDSGGLLLSRDVFHPGFPSMLPKSLPHLPTDLGLIERAARFSCFNGGGNFVNRFTLPDSVNPPHMELARGSNEIHGGVLANATTGMQQQNSKSFKEEKRASGNESDEADFSGYGEMEGFVSKKRKHEGGDEENDGSQKGLVETSRENDAAKQNGDRNLTRKGKSSEGKHAVKSQGSDLPKEGYVHIRARRGQATNSHSLAERVRREKISERMKFLQDLVPGCSKVTGKAVMLDEIINYVQSLQRQVEFLSMKLAAVNSHMDLNIEGLLAKDMLHIQQPGRVGMPSSSMAFPPHVAAIPFPLLLQPEHGMMQTTGLVGSSSEAIRSLPPGEAASASQVHDCCWKDDLHNIVQHMGFNSTATPSNSQDVNGSPGHTKGEP